MCWLQMQRSILSSFLDSINSIIILIPKNPSNPKAIQWSSDFIYFSKLIPNNHPESGIIPWNIPNAKAIFTHIFLLKFLKVIPLDTDTANASIASAIAVIKIVTKLISFLLIIFFKQKRRLNVCQIGIHESRFLILDQTKSHYVDLETLNCASYSLSEC